METNNIKLSIIIPYFETYELTQRLLNSLIPQSHKTLEIILIDDGCNDYFNNYLILRSFDNFRLIHQDNMGVAKTRNRGIDIAKGKYIAFIDCDDMVTPNYVETLLKAIDTYDTDIINFNWLEYTQNKVWMRPSNYAPWKAIYKKETMLKFREDREYGAEDVDFQEEIDKKIRNNEYTITYLDRVLYIYSDNREGSLYWKKTHK